VCVMSDMSDHDEAPAGAEFDDNAPDADADEVEVDTADVADAQASPGTTGNEVVDTVLASLDGLDDSPVAEHVEVFERAHEQLRSALDGPRDA
jgi:hypothetical protein